MDDLEDTHSTMESILKNPTKFDSFIRSITASLIALSLIAALLYIAITADGKPAEIARQALASAALVVIGFYFGGHVAQNTAAIEERRQQIATAASRDSASRSEESALRSEASSQKTK